MNALHGQKFKNHRNSFDINLINVGLQKSQTCIRDDQDFFEEPYKNGYKRRQTVNDEIRGFKTLSPEKNLIMPKQNEAFSLHEIISKQSKEIQELKRINTQIVKQQTIAEPSNKSNLYERNSITNQSVRSKRTYRDLVNKIQNQKTMLENYYAGPPKYEQDSSMSNSNINRRIQALNQVELSAHGDKTSDKIRMPLRSVAEEYEINKQDQNNLILSSSKIEPSALETSFHTEKKPQPS